MLDPELTVELWSDQAQDLWGLRADEVQGQPFLALDIGLPVERLAAPIRDCLDGDGKPHSSPLLLDGVNRRGRSIQCQMTCTPLSNGTETVSGVILLMEEVLREEAPQA